MVLVELGFIEPLAILKAAEMVLRLVAKKSKPARANPNSPLNLLLSSCKRKVLGLPKVVLSVLPVLMDLR